MIGVIFNPTARGEKASSFRKSLAGLGEDVRVVPTRFAGDARTLATELVQSGVDTVVAAGGDGTVNEVLNGMADAPEGLQRARLGVLPLGTVNVFAKELGLPAALPSAWDILRAGRERRMDLPHAEFAGSEGERVGRHFILMAGAGLDSRAIRLVDWNLKKRVGPLAYVWAGVQAMRRPHSRVTARVGGREWAVELAEIGNGRFYGGRFPVFPHARLEDGILDATLFPRVGWGVGLRTFLRLLADRMAGSSDAVFTAAQRIELHSEDPVCLHLDGDVVGTLPAVLTVQREVLRVVVP